MMVIFPLEPSERPSLALLVAWLAWSTKEHTQAFELGRSIGRSSSSRELATVYSLGYGHMANHYLMRMASNCRTGALVLLHFTSPLWSWPRSTFQVFSRSTLSLTSLDRYCPSQSSLDIWCLLSHTSRRSFVVPHIV